MQSVPNEYAHYLRWQATHDYFASVALVIATFTIVPLAILLVPIITFVFIVAGSERISKSARKRLDAVVKIPRNVFLLQSNSHQISVFSLPFFSVLKIPERIIQEKDTEDLAVMVRHELSHHLRHDTTKILWVSISSCFLLYYFTSSMLINLVFFPEPGSDGHLLGRMVANCVLVALVIVLVSALYISSLPEVQRTRRDRHITIVQVSVSVICGLAGSWFGYQNGFFGEPFQGIAPRPEIDRQATEFWGAVMVSCALLMLVFLRGMCHRIEYLADIEAAERNKEASIRFWEKRASPKLIDRSKNFLISIFNWFLHPSNHQRYAGVAGKLKKGSISLFLYTFVWSLVCCFVLLRAVTDGRSSYGEGVLRFVNDLGLLGLTVVFFVVGYGIHSIARLQRRVMDLRNFAVFSGYMIGTVLAFLSLYLFERSAFGFEHLRPQGVSDFLLLASIGFYTLLLASCLAADLSKQSRLSALILTALCIFASFIVATASLMEGLNVPSIIAFVSILVLMTTVFACVIAILRLLYLAWSAVQQRWL